MSNQYKEIDGGQYLIADPAIINESPDVCFLVESKYYRLSKGAITYDYTKKRYVLKTAINVENGFIGIDKDDKPILGDWSWPKEHLLEDTIMANYKSQQFICISEDIFKDTNWEERLFDGEFYLKSDLPVKEFSKIKLVPREVKNRLPYNASEALKKASKIYQIKFNPATKDFNKGVASYPQVLGKYSYGFEFETVKGILPSRINNRLGLIPLRDGSIEGIEYATIPLEGKNGLQTIIEACEELEKRTTYDVDCSLHIHIGGMPRTEAYFIALTKILCSVQEEMYEMFPFYTRGGFGLKKKDYTAPLPAVELMTKINNFIDVSSKKELVSNFEPIFDFLSMGHRYADYKNSLTNVISHPSDPGGTNKWYVKSRYRWVNMIPLLFGNKKTIEFRIHTPTYEPNKIIYFAIICAAIVDAADRQNKAILEGTIRHYTLSDFVYSYLTQFGDKYAHVHDIIHKYITDRKYYSKGSIQAKDFYGKEKEFNPRHLLYQRDKDTYSYLSEDLKKNIYPEDVYRTLDRVLREEPRLRFNDSPPPRFATRASRAPTFTGGTDSGPVWVGSGNVVTEAVNLEEPQPNDDFL